VKNLSGGNQQKVVFGKWSSQQLRVLLLDEPTVGVDVGAREEIYGLVHGAARSGTAVLVVSSDLAELLRLCHRISIVADGTIAETIDRDELDGTEALHHLIQLPRAAAQMS
jgi:ribose transport system ATP-binding protein